MNVVETSLRGVFIFEPKVFGDARGFLLETYRYQRYAEAGVDLHFVQDCWSRSVKGTVRGLHFQEPRAQGKLVHVTRGAIFDVAVDIRKGSPGFGKWVGVELTEENKRQLWVPPGFAHGFCVLSEIADLQYKCTDIYLPEAERTIAWNDPQLAISWPLPQPPILSKKDAEARPLKETAVLPAFGG
ncbi:MAG: dTDP-4-dehydrorhamnose 3,5-epimerase [Myxococcales bacterium]|nr:dTDP-4-dehydrorhamnose 3,5-epimerase [Myxococcales bacterium]